jgi:hypothetical protein
MGLLTPSMESKACQRAPGYYTSIDQLDRWGKLIAEMDAQAKAFLRVAKQKLDISLSNQSRGQYGMDATK